MIPDVLRHRLVLSYDALADEVSPDDVIKRVLQTVGLPQVAAQAVAPGGAAPAAPMPAPAAPPVMGPHGGQPGIAPQGIPQPPNGLVPGVPGQPQPK